MRVLELKPQITLKNILFATDFEVSASRALPFAVALANRYEAKLYAAHVIPPEVYALASPESIDRALKEAGDFAGYTLNQITASLRCHGLRCEALLGDGNVADVIEEWVQTYSADLVVVGTISRAGWGKVVLGSVAEEVIREATCPVLTVGPQVTTLASAGVHSVVCATDFSSASQRAVDFAMLLASEYEAHLTLVHVIEGSLRGLQREAIQQDEKRLREMIPREPELLYRPEVVVEAGSVAERILDVAANLSADFIVMGVRGAGAFAQTASRFGSIAHRVVALAPCPVVTIGDVRNTNED
ncbi:MAG TPA: universal stress protein [Candidatus Dormibacteraeota bacterium]|nr:universal stress protein [Candidatus Dormibacteraeota bacterium]